MKKFLVLCICALGIAVPVLAQYQFVPIQHPDGNNFTYVAGINDNGLITGSFTGVSGPMHPFKYKFGTYTGLGTGTVVWGTTAEAMHSNNRGDVVGYYRDTVTGNQRGYMLSKDGQLTLLDYPGADFTMAADISDNGTVVGNYGFVDQTGTPVEEHGFIWMRGTFTRVDYPGATSSAVTGINSYGVLVGWWSSGLWWTGGEVNSFSFSNGQFSNLVIPDAFFIGAQDVNDSGTIVGYYLGPDFGLHGFALVSSSVTTLDYPGAFLTFVFGINNAGQISGTIMNDSFGYSGFIAQPLVLGKPAAK